jgi:hypothetical protein
MYCHMNKKALENSGAFLCPGIASAARAGTDGERGNLIVMPTNVEASLII